MTRQKNTDVELQQIAAWTALAETIWTPKGDSGDAFWQVMAYRPALVPARIDSEVEYIV